MREWVEIVRDEEGMKQKIQPARLAQVLTLLQASMTVLTANLHLNHPELCRYQCAHGMQCVAHSISAYCFPKKLAVFGHSGFALPGLFDVYIYYTGWNDDG